MVIPVHCYNIAIVLIIAVFSIEQAYSEVEPCIHSLDSCEGHYTCVDGTKQCLDGYTGDDCKDKMMDRDDNDEECLHGLSSNTECHQNGYCFRGFCCCDNTELYDPFLQCRPRVIPQAMSQGDGDVCDSNTDCHNGGRCDDGVCCCEPGYEGLRCEAEIDDCVGAPCGSGSCTDVHMGYVCRCEDGSRGARCEGVSAAGENFGSTQPLNPDDTCSNRSGAVTIATNSVSVVSVCSVGVMTLWVMAGW